MSQFINKDNYESFYLDFLEGNLNEVDTALLFEFLENNPSFKVDHSELESIAPDQSIQLDSLHISLLKFPSNDQKIDFSNMEFFMIASTEDLLSADKQIELHLFLNQNPQYLVDKAFYDKSHFAVDHSIVFEDKRKLKKGIIIPMYARFLAAAAGVALLFSLLNINQGTQSENVASIAKQINKNRSKKLPKLNENPIQIAVNNTIETDEKTIAIKAKVISASEQFVETEIAEPLVFKSSQKFKTKPLLQDVAVSYTATIVDSKEEQAPQNTYALVEMKNPIKPLTSRVGDAINKQIEFKTTKAAKRKPGGFLLKIGKLEISKKVYESTSVASK